MNLIKLFMTEEEITMIAEKIKNGTATEEETLKFHEEFNNLLSNIKNTLLEE